MSATTWQPPSIAAMGKLPAIDIEGVNRSQYYLDWFDAHPEIPRAIPPIYRDFIIRHSRSYYSPDKDKAERVYSYIECIHYNDDMTELDACHVIDGKKVLTVHSRYLDYDGIHVKASLSAPGSTRYTEEWLRREGIATIYTALALQAYILYHRPEVVPVYLSEAATQKRNVKSVPAKKSAVKKITPTVKRYIRLSEADVERVTRQYRAIQWMVRGHYRRYTRKNGEQYLRFVAPHTAKRGEKKLKTSGIILSGGKDDKK